MVMGLVRAAVIALMTVCATNAALAGPGGGPPPPPPPPPPPLLTPPPLRRGAWCVVPAGETATGRVDAMQDLPGGAVLIGAENGLFIALARPLAAAEVTFITDFQRLTPGPNWEEVRFTFSHPCAAASGYLALTLVASLDNIERGREDVRLARASPPSADSTGAVLAAPMRFDQPGKWILQLWQGSTLIGQPLSFSLRARSFWEILVSAWETVLAAFSVLYILSFGALLLLTRRHAGAFRILSDAVWAKFLTWPFFFLRNAPPVQRWVLEPWFQAIRRSTQTNVPFHDPPISNASGSQTEGTALLHRLRDAPRLSLQGRSGMGKSSVFVAWERAYFAATEAPTLSAAVRRYGFILIVLPVRQYAALLPPEANRPESWVLEAVRRRLEQFGLVTRDLGLIDAMLRAGHIALALDGTNEADRDTAIDAFAHQFSQVSMLITSQSSEWKDWEGWHLPEDVSALRESLLALWLGTEQGASLSRRIVAEGLSETIVSGYDLRLIADLAGADPEHTPLPANRIALYRAMLARVTGADGRPLHLARLKQLAWGMVTQRRREIVLDDEKLLGAGTLKAPAKEGVRIVRPVGPVHEFRHDQMRAFLAALWLFDETPNLSAMEKAATDAAFVLNPGTRRNFGVFSRHCWSQRRTSKSCGALQTKIPNRARYCSPPCRPRPMNAMSLLSGPRGDGGQRTRGKRCKTLDGVHGPRSRHRCATARGAVHHADYHHRSGSRQTLVPGPRRRRKWAHRRSQAAGRSGAIAYFRSLEPCLVGMEACARAHHWERELTALGHTVKLMPPACVKACVERNKNDAADADALCEAVTQPSMRFVPVKDAEQQSVLMLHWARSLLVGNARCWSMHCALTWPNSAALRHRVSGMPRS
jgi:hypothetical protein